MSRVGKRIIIMPEGTSIKIDDDLVTVYGKLGLISKKFPSSIKILVNSNQISVKRANDEKQTKQLHGTVNSILQGMVKGVSEGFKKEIEIKGVGYNAKLKNEQIEINAGYSHQIFLNIIKGVKIEIPKPVHIIVSGIDKQLVGQMAALIRNVRRVSPYSGKGIIYKGEYVRRKEGKTVNK